MNMEKWVKEKIEKTQAELKSLKQQLMNEQITLRQLQIAVIERQGRLAALNEALEKLGGKEKHHGK